MVCETPRYRGQYIRVCVWWCSKERVKGFVALPLNFFRDFTNVTSIHRHFHLFFYILFSRYGDMRKEIGFKIRDMWYNLGEFQLKNYLYSNSRAEFQVLYFFIKAAGV